MLLDHLPNILIFQVKRFSYDYTYNVPIKIDKDMEYPSGFTMPRRYFSQTLTDQLHSSSMIMNDIVYNLVGVVLHHGDRATGGHYTSFVQDPAKQVSSLVSCSLSILIHDMDHMIVEILR